MARVIPNNMFGYNYKLPTDYNPWQLNTSPGENAGWNWGNTLGYKQDADTTRWDLAQTGPGSDSNRGRVLRWMMDYLGENPGGASQSEAQQAFALALSRLRRDYDVTKKDWNTSGFAGLDTYLQGKETIGDAASGTAPPKSPPAVVNPPPPTITGDASGGGGGGGGGAAGGGKVEGSSTAYSDYYLRNPREALIAALEKRGYDVTKPGILGSFMMNTYGPTMEARMAAAGAGGGNAAPQVEDIMNEIAAGIFGNAGNFYNRQEQVADEAIRGSQGYLNGLNDQNEAADFLESMYALKYGGRNAMVRQSLTDIFNRNRGQYTRRAIEKESQGGNVDPFATWWEQQSPYNTYFRPR